MKEVKPTYKISSEAANIIADTFWNLKGRVQEGGASSEDRNIKLSLAQKVVENKAHMTFVAEFRDEWGTETAVQLRNVTFVTVKDGCLDVESEGISVFFDIRDC